MDIKIPLSSSNLLHNYGLYSYIGYGMTYHAHRFYHIRRLTWDEDQQTEYQKLRADIFVHQLGWALPIDSQGRERDHYDRDPPDHVTIHGVYGSVYNKLYLLGGVRIFELNNWSESMTWNEFSVAGMIPQEILRTIQDKYDVQTILELTRFCIQKGTSNRIFPSLFDSSAIRDYTYASVYAYAERYNRPYALALVHHGYFCVLKKANFVFETLCTHFHAPKKADRYALIIIHLPATIHSLSISQPERAARMMSLCNVQR